MEAMSELTLSIAAEINSALQTIIGHCDLLERGYPDPDLQRDLATVVRQAQRITTCSNRCAPRRRTGSRKWPMPSIRAGFRRVLRRTGRQR